MFAAQGLAHRIGWSALSTVTSFVASFVTTVAISRMVDPAEYGRMSVVLATWGFLAVPITWCGSLLARFGPVELDRTGRLSQTLGARLLFAWPVLAALVVAVPVVLAPSLGWTALLTSLSIAFLLGTVLEDVTNWIGIATQSFRAMALVHLVSRGLPLAMVLAPLIVPFHLRAEHLLGAKVGATMVGSLACIVALRKLLSIGRPNAEQLRAMWRYIAPAAVGVPAATVIMWIDPLVLDLFVEKSEVGHYQMAYVVMTIGTMASGSLIAVLSPEMVRAVSRGSRDAFGAYLAQHQPRLAILLGSLAFAGACFAEPLLSVVLGPRYASAGRIAGILCVAAGFQMASATLQPIVTAGDGQVGNQAAKVLQAAVNVAGDVVLGRPFGALGVAFANVIACFSGAILTTLFLRRRMPVGSYPWAILAGLALPVAALIFTSPPLPVRIACAVGLGGAAAFSALGLYRTRAPGT